MKQGKAEDGSRAEGAGASVAETARTEEEARIERKLRKARRTARYGYPVLRALAATWRTTWPGVERLYDASGKPRPGILTSWHATLLPGTWIGRGRGLGVMVSQHGDGEIIAKVLAKFGYEAYRGSSTRGGARALISMLRVPLETLLVMTPDGPKGPVGEIQNGVILLAERGRRLIFPSGIAASRAWHARSWDRFVIPKPFARVVLYTGAGIEIPPGSSKDKAALESWRAKIKQALDEAQSTAAKIACGALADPGPCGEAFDSA